MARRVSWRWIGGCRCPYCSGPVQWYTQEKRDGHSPRGFAEVKEPFRHTDGRKKYVTDTEVSTPMGGQGHEVYVKKEYKHTYDVYCKRCNLLMSQTVLVQGEPDEYPAGYWEVV